MPWLLIGPLGAGRRLVTLSGCFLGHFSVGHVHPRRLAKQPCALAVRTLSAGERSLKSGVKGGGQRCICKLMGYVLPLLAWVIGVRGTSACCGPPRASRRS